MYKFLEIKNNSFIFERISKSRSDTQDILKINKNINNCIIIEPLIKNECLLDNKWKLRCFCGNNFYKKLHRLKYENQNISCGCILKNKNKEKLKFNEYINTKHKNCLILSPINLDKKSVNDIWKIKCFCGNIFKVQLSNFIYGTTESCGCYKKQLQQENMKLRHENLRISKGLNKDQYIQDIDKFLRNTIFAYVRPIVRKIDQNICALCLKFGNHIHHIDPIKNINNYKNLNNFFLVYDLNNLITLCNKCHRLAHNYNSKNIDINIQNDLKQIVSMRFVNKNINDNYLTVCNDIQNNILNWLNHV